MPSCEDPFWTPRSYFFEPLSLLCADDPKTRNLIPLQLPSVMHLSFEQAHEALLAFGAWGEIYPWEMAEDLEALRDAIQGVYKSSRKQVVSAIARITMLYATRVDTSDPSANKVLLLFSSCESGYIDLAFSCVKS